MSALDKPVLVDTSVWIAYFRKEAAAFAGINQLADAGRVCLLGLILAELYQGCKSEKELSVVHDLAEVFPRLDEPEGMWEEAGRLAYNWRKQEHTPGLADCYIAIAAKRAGALIYSYDKHFGELAPFCGVEQYNLTNID